VVTEAVAKAGRCGEAGGMGGRRLSACSPQTDGHAWGAMKSRVAIQGM